MKCTRCPKPWYQHRMEDGHRFCDDGTRALATPRLAASQSFSPDEVKVLEELLRAAQWGQPASVAILRGKSFASLARKVHSMKERVARIKKQRDEARAGLPAHAPGHE